MTPYPKRRRLQCLLSLGILLLAVLTASCAQSSPAATGSRSPAETGAANSAASMEAVHVSYLDLTANITDLRTRVTDWQKGDDNGLNIAKEKVERIQAILASVTWPSLLMPTAGAAYAAVAPMAKALAAQDKPAAQAAAETFGAASHDLTHAFYGDWLPTLKGKSFTAMAPHATYLDLSANLSDLQARVGQWQKGDESSLNIGKEKLDRVRVLAQHMASFKMLAKPLQSITAALPAVAAALDHKDLAAAQSALKPLSEGSHDLTHDFYEWMGKTTSANDPACIQAAYLDISRNMTDLRARLTQWQQGDEASLNIAQEKLDRMAAISGHTGWPVAMATAIGSTRATVEPIRHALKDKNVAQALTAVAPLATSSHDLTHAFYGDWLPKAYAPAQAAHGMTGMGNMPGPATGGQPAPTSGVVAFPAATPVAAHVDVEPHSSSAAGKQAAAVASPATKRAVIGGFGLVNGLVIATAAIFKAKTGKGRAVSGQGGQNS